MDGGEKRAGAGSDSRWLDKANGCRRRLRIAVIFRASRRCRRAGLPSCSVEAAKPAMKTNRISTEIRSGREQ